MKQTQDFPQLCTVQTAAEILNVTTHTIRRWIRTGHLRAVRLSERTTRIPMDAIRELLERSELRKDSEA